MLKQVHLPIRCEHLLVVSCLLILTVSYNKQTYISSWAKNGVGYRNKQLWTSPVFIKAELAGWQDRRTLSWLVLYLFADLHETDHSGELATTPTHQTEYLSIAVLCAASTYLSPNQPVIMNHDTMVRFINSQNWLTINTCQLLRINLSRRRDSNGRY